jgi:hypothetical protein
MPPVDPTEPAIPTEPVTPVDPLTPVDPVDPNFPPNPDVGTDEADSLTASRDQVTNGLGSDDLIFVGSNATGAIISADAGNDQIEIDRASGVTVNGSNGDDLIFMEGTRDMVANGGRGDDIFRGGGQNFDLNGGDGDDRFELVGSGEARGGAGDDVFFNTGQYANLSGSSFGGAGDDVMQLDGGGNTLNGGAGDDLLYVQGILGDVSGTITPPFTFNTFNTFTTGAGADIIALDFGAVRDTDDLSGGLVAVITDFEPGEDMLMIDPSYLNRAEADGVPEAYTQTLTFTPNPAEGYTDMAIDLVSVANGNTLTATVRFEGTTTITEADVGMLLGLPEGVPVAR